jgi:hypothetical protein
MILVTVLCGPAQSVSLICSDRYNPAPPAVFNFSPGIGKPAAQRSYTQSADLLVTVYLGKRILKAGYDDHNKKNNGIYLFRKGFHFIHNFLLIQ